MTHQFAKIYLYPSTRIECVTHDRDKTLTPHTNKNTANQAMDLLQLGGYDSDSSHEDAQNHEEDDEDDKVDTVEPKKTGKEAPSGSEGSNTNSHKNETNDHPVSTDHRVRRKVLALQSVLPPHIFAQLQKETLHENESDSDDDNDQEMPRAGSEPWGVAPPTSHTAAATGGLSLLLNELKKTPATTTATAPPTLGAAIEKDFVRAIPNGNMGISDQESSLQNRRVVVTAAPRGSRETGMDTELLPDHHEEATAVYNTRMTDSMPETSHNMTAVSKKRRRQEIEKELRSGNVAIVEGTTTTQVQGAHPTQYQPATMDRLETPGLGIAVVPTLRYDPSRGETVSVVGRTTADGAPTTMRSGRGKNQINVLLANAAALQQRRQQQQEIAASLQQQQGGAASAPPVNPGKAHRAKAKQKYGW
jgi:hypothetical protein